MRVAVLITGGGTGGHVYPALSIVRALRNRLSPERPPSSSPLPEASDAPVPALPAEEMIYVGSSRGMERTLVPPTGLRSFFMAMAPPASLRGAFLLGLATLRSAILIGRMRPRVTVATGGYVCVPAALASWLLRVPVVLFLPDIVPGKAVRTLIPLVRRIAVTTEDSLRYLPAKKTVVTGYPLREAFVHAGRETGRRRFGVPEEATVLGVFGGSLGARNINSALARILPDLLASYHVIHVCGRDRYEEMQAATRRLTEVQRARYHLFPYLEGDEMADALAASDLAVMRSGASTLAELPALGTPAVLVPLPIPGVHQRENAQFLASHGAAVVLEDAVLGDRLHDVLEVLLQDRGRLEQMAEACSALARIDAADRIAALTFEAAR